MWSVWQTWKMAPRAAGFLGAVLAAVLLAALPAGAAFVEPMNLSNSAAASQLPAIAVNRAGQVFVAWAEGGDIFFARSQPPQASCGGPGAPKFEPALTLWNGTVSGGASAPALAATDSGGVFVAWLASSAVWFRRSTDDGQTFSPAVNLSAAVGPARSPSVAADNTGGVFVAWSGGFFRPEILLARSTDFGASFGPGAPANVSGTPATNSVAPSVAADGSNVYLVWEEGNFVPWAQSISILYRKFGRLADLTTAAAALPTNLSTGLGNAFSPSVAVGDGLLSVAFASLNGPSVYHRSSSDGITFSAPAENVSGAVPVPTGVRVARRNGSALVTWAQRLDATTSNTDIRYRLLGNGGMAAPATVAPTPGASRSSAAAIGFDDRLLVAWQENVNFDDEIYLSYSGGGGGGTMIQATVWTKHKVLDLRHLAKGHRGHSDGESDGEHHGGGHFKVFIELPGGLARDIDPTTLQLNGQPALLAPNKPDDDDDDEKDKLDDDWAELEDENDNGIPDLKVKFSRSALAAVGQTDAQGNGSYEVTGRTKSGGCFAGTAWVQTRW